MTFTLQQIAGALGLAAGAAEPITGWSVDTRSLEPGDLFFALKGPVHDGNAYIDAALDRGASAVIAERSADHSASRPVLVVQDSLLALRQIASWARNQWAGDVIGVTGSAGKTSTKDVIAALLSVRLRAGKTYGNFNNHVGLPLSILRMAEDSQVAVLELGMNHAGEIRDLTQIARPRVGVVTNVGHAHIEFFDSIDGIAAAKRELIESLPSDGIAVLNSDDPRVARFSEAHPGRTIAFGLGENAEVRAEDVQMTRAGARFRVGGLKFETSLTGRHGIRNILAGIVVSGLYGIDAADLISAVRDLKPGHMRGDRVCYHGMELLNDCYNSNPDAAMSMVDVLRETPAVRRIAVLGEMLELGRWSESLHRDVGRYVAASGIDVLVGLRGAARAMADAAIDAGLPASAAYFFDDPAEAGYRLRAMAREGDAILFKGSRGTHVERALETFLMDAASGQVNY